MKIKMSSIAFFFAVILMFSCSKSDPAPAVDCAALSKKITDALLAYAASPTTTTCTAYAAALKEFIDKANSCGAVISPADLADLKTDLAALQC